MQSKQDIDRNYGSLNSDEDLEMKGLVKNGEATADRKQSVGLKLTVAKYSYLPQLYSKLLMPWMALANWYLDVEIALKLWNGHRVYGDVESPVNTRTYAIAYMAVLFLSLRFQTLFFIIRDNSYPLFDQYSAWSKVRTALFYIPVVGSIRQSRMTINNYEENVLKPAGQTLDSRNKWAAILEGALFIEITAWVTIPFMMVRKVLWTLRVWKNDVCDDVDNSADFVLNGNIAKLRKKEEKKLLNQESKGEGEDPTTLSVSETGFSKKANPIYSIGFTYKKVLDYVSMWTSVLEDLPQLLILVFLEIVLNATSPSRGDMGFVKRVISILTSQPKIWGKLALSLTGLLQTLHLLRTTNIVDFMEAKDEEEMGGNFKLR